MNLENLKTIMLRNDSDKSGILEKTNCLKMNFLAALCAGFDRGDSVKHVELKIISKMS